MQVREPRETLHIDEVAVILGVSRSSAYNAAKAGEIPTIRIGRRILVPRDALAKMLAASPEESR